MDSILDLVIVGSGAAGLTAGIYAKRAGLNFVIIEKEFASGGQIINTYEIDNYPGIYGISGYELATRLREHADHLGAKIVSDNALEIKKSDKYIEVMAKKNTYRAAAAIVATGARHKLLEILGEEKYSGMGVSYCATCDGAFYKDKTVAVIGGGDAALEDALFLSKICRKVYLIHRRDEFRAAASIQNKVIESSNIELIMDTALCEIVGDERLRQINIKNLKTEDKNSIQLDGLFVAVGATPNSDICAAVHKDSNGYIVAAEDCKTSIDGIFAAGDVRTKKLRQVITACADGAVAVASAYDYLRSINI